MGLNVINEDGVPSAMASGKKVELFELFYDLIFVYAVSRLTLLMEEPEGGIVTSEMVAVYAIFLMLIIQTWFMMTSYVNRCCTWRWHDYVLLALNMSAAVLMAQSMSGDPDESSTALMVSIAMMTGSVIVLYAIHYLGDGPQKGYAKRSLAVLAVIEAVYMAALCLKFAGSEEISKYIIAANIAVGMILPLMNRRGEFAECVHFPHLVERMELFTIIMFGEALISVTGFFKMVDPEPLGIINFLIIIVMFGFYVCRVHLMCDHRGPAVSDRMVGCHYLIYVAISAITVAFKYMEGGEVDSFVTATFMAVSMLLFNLALLSTSRYYKDGLAAGSKDIAMGLLFTAIGIAVMLAFHGEHYALSIGALIGFGANLALSLMMYRGRTAAGREPVERWNTTS